MTRIYWQTEDVTLYQGHTLEVLRQLPEASVHVCVTSPPYYGLRAYGTDPVVWGGDPGHAHEWTETFTPNANAGGGTGYKQDTNVGSWHGENLRDGGGPLPRKHDGPRGRTTAFCRCGAVKCELGSEPSVSLYVANLVAVFAEVWRVLRPDATLWLNIADSYNGSGGAGGDYSADGIRAGQPRYAGRREGGVLKPKDMMGVPWRVALALQEWGWWLRSDICWAKTSCMPSSVTDRPTSSYEHIFLLTKQPNYYYDVDAIREPYAPSSLPQIGANYGGLGLKEYEANGVQNPSDTKRRVIESMERNGGAQLRDVWTLGPDPYPGAHFATFPRAIPERAIRLGSSEKGCCSGCGKGWRRVVKDTPEYAAVKARQNWKENRGETMITGNEFGRSTQARVTKDTVTVGWSPSCSCPPAEPIPCTILDPFNGAGTTGLAALANGRRYVGIELKPDYCELTRGRLEPLTSQGRLFGLGEVA